jgi:hypothetical protein
MLAAFDFDMRFTYVLAGWEGSPMMQRFSGRQLGEI